MLFLRKISPRILEVPAFSPLPQNIASHATVASTASRFPPILFALCVVIRSQLVRLARGDAVQIEISFLFGVWIQGHPVDTYQRW